MIIGKLSVSAQGLKRLQQMAFLFAMETGLCFSGYSGNRSLLVVSPFQLLELLNPPVETKGGRYADTFLGRKPLGPGAELRLGQGGVRSARQVFVREAACRSPLLVEAASDR